MLTDVNLKSSYAIASQAFNAKRTIGAVPETPLAAAVAATLNEFRIINDTNLDGRCATPDGIIEMLQEGCSSADAFGQHKHDEIIKDLKDRIAPVVQRTFFIARNAVVPATNKAFDQYRNALAEIEKKAYLPQTIDVFKPSHFWDNPSFQMMVSRYKDANVPSINIKQMGLDINEGNALDYLRTGIADFDERTRASIVPAEAALILAKVFGQPGAPALFGAALAERLSDVLVVDYTNWMDNSAFIFLAAKNLLENTPENLNMDLNEYREYMTSVLAASGRVANAMFDRIDADRRMKKIVLTSTQESLKVDGPTWFAFCQESGDTETLYGSLMTDRNLGYANLLAKKGEYRRAFENFVNSQTAQWQGKRHAECQDAIFTAIVENIQDLLADEFKNNANASLEQLTKELLDRTKALTAAEVTNAYETIRALICGQVYPGTDVLAVLQHYDAAAPLIDSKDPREIAALALRNYVTDWLSDQVLVESFSYPAEL